MSYRNQPAIRELGEHMWQTDCSNIASTWSGTVRGSNNGSKSSSRLSIGRKSQSGINKTINCGKKVNVLHNHTKCTIIMVIEKLCIMPLLLSIYTVYIYIYIPIILSCPIKAGRSWEGGADQLIEQMWQHVAGSICRCTKSSSGSKSSSQGKSTEVVALKQTGSKSASSGSKLVKVVKWVQKGVAESVGGNFDQSESR